MDNKNQKQKIFLIVIGLGVFGLVGLGYFLGSRSKSSTINTAGAPAAPAIKLSNTPNTNAIYLANPVMSVAGKVVGKSGNSLSIEAVSFAQPGGESKMVKVNVKVPESAQMYRQPLSLPYFAPKPATNTPPKTYTTKDINNGDYVSIGLLTDYRFTRDNDLTATSVSIIPGSNTLIGAITEVSGRTIKVTGTVTGNFPGAQDPKITPEPPKVYTVTLGNDTEINASTQTGNKQSGLSDLKTGYSINVYGADSIKSTSFTAAIVYVTLPANTAPLTPAVTTAPEATLTVAPTATPTPTRVTTPSATPNPTTTN